MTRRVMAIASVSLRRMLRDRRALFFVLALPVLISFVVGAVFGGGESSVDAGVVSAGSGNLGDDLVARLDRSRAIDVERYDDLASLREAVRQERVAAGVVVPRGYDRSLRDGERARVTLLADPTQSRASIVRTTLAAATAGQASEVAAARFAATHASVPVDEALEVVRGVVRNQPRVSVRRVDVGGDGGDVLDNRFSYTVPSNLVLFVFITSLAAGSMLVESRRLGVSQRMLSTPTSAGVLLAGEVLGRFVIAAFQAMVIVVSGWVVFQIDWGDPVAATALVLSFVLVATGAGMLVGSIARTGEQAASLGPPIGIGLGMLGGCMWPLEIVPPVMQAIGRLTPHAWAMSAWIEVVQGGARIGEIAGELAVLLLFAALVLPLAAWRLQRTLVSSGPA